MTKERDQESFDPEEWVREQGELDMGNFRPDQRWISECARALAAIESLESLAPAHLESSLWNIRSNLIWFIDGFADSHYDSNATPEWLDSMTACLSAAQVLCESIGPSERRESEAVTYFWEGITEAIARSRTSETTQAL